MSVSPLTFQIAIACYVSPDPADEVGISWHSSAGRDSRDWLFFEGLIDEDNRATDKCIAWIKRALATPLPAQTWTFPATPPEDTQ